ncbi:hypothetical protein V3H38_10945 [Vibrio parahaemolyticus]|uniref:hypothetical protein n=1 Tax=Vibrio parahaemolyticus TaxID=670 RepID=UPI002362F1FA|nr:hypothetical protein [Vibrio parahaemolyticus]
MDKLVIDPIVIEKQIGKKLNAAQTLGMSPASVLNDLNDFLQNALDDWVEEFFDEVHAKIERGHDFKEDAKSSLETNKVRIKAKRK